MKNILVILVSVLIFLPPDSSRADHSPNLARGAKVRASSTLQPYVADKAVDGIVTNDSRWLSDDSKGLHVLEIDFGRKVNIGCVQVLMGWENHGTWVSAVQNFKIQFHKEDQWKDDEKLQISNNQKTGIEFYLVEPIQSDKIRFVSSDQGPIRIVEIRAFEWGGEYPSLFDEEEIVFAKHPVFVNQSGYNLEWPKRFTAPLVKETAQFTIREVGSTEILYQGTVNEGVGDFSDFKPVGHGIEYMITVIGGELQPGQSDPFRIESEWIQRICLEPAVRFMQDARSVTGTHPSAFGGCPWRDGTYYSFEVPSLVMLYLSYSDMFKQMPIEINYQKDKERVLDPTFKLVKTTKDEASLETARRYFTELDGPVGQDVPDIIQLIHWGIGWYLLDPKSHDWYGDPLGDRIHSQTVEQFAYFMYGYPAYNKYFTEKFYQQACKFVFEHWRKVGLLEVNTTIGTFKGRHCPGHSIMPNLMMYEVAKRHNCSDAEEYLKAAQRQTQWVIDELDWNDPITTKGQRMSEHKLITGLVFFLKRYPQFAPAGLQNKINEWADIMISRSNNMWDFRRYDDKEWSLPRFTAGSHGGAGWNEPGNIAGFPALCFAVASVTNDTKKKDRLMEIGVSHFDNIFGRNPLGAHSGYYGPKDFAGVERGWPKMFPKDRCARLELVRGTLNSTCTSEHYPFNPKHEFRHVEGWTAFNAAFNVSIAFCHEIDWPDSENNN